MNTLISLIFSVLLMAPAFTIPRAVSAQVAIKTDTGTYPENPKVIQLPSAGGKYIDDLSGIPVLRLTDERDGKSFSTTYPVWNAFNRDATRVWLFEHGGPYYVGKLDPNTLERTGPLEAVVPARGSFVDYESANWSGLDNDKTFIAVDCQIWSYKPSTKTYQVVADLRSFFPAGARFNQLYVSRDDNRFAAVVRSGSSGSGDHGVMVYELSSNTIKLNASFTDINGITMDKSGKYVLLVRNDPEGQIKQRVFNVDTGAVETLLSDANGKPDYCIGHNDTGSDFIVGGDQWRGAFTVRNLSNPHDVRVAWQYAGLGWINWHISQRADNEHWALVSTYGGLLTVVNGEVVTLQDGPFLREIFQVGVKEPFLGQFRRLVHTRANWTPQFYWDTPRGVISPDGRLIAWTSNNNAPSGSGRTDVFVAWIEPAPSAVPTPSPNPSPVATPTPAPSPSPTPVPSPVVTPTPVPSPTATPKPSPTSLPSPSPSPTPTPSGKRCKWWPPNKWFSCL